MAAWFRNATGFKVERKVTCRELSELLRQPPCLMTFLSEFLDLASYDEVPDFQ